MNGVPLSDVISSGTPKRAIQWLSRASTQFSVFAVLIGTASGHLVDRLMMVKRYRCSLEAGSGPTMSTCMCPNLLLGCSNSRCLILCVVGPWRVDRRCRIWPKPWSPLRCLSIRICRSSSSSWSSSMDGRARGWRRIPSSSSSSGSRVLAFRCWCRTGFCRICRRGRLRRVWVMWLFFRCRLLLAGVVGVLVGWVPGVLLRWCFWRERRPRRFLYLRCGGRYSQTRRWRRVVVAVGWNTDLSFSWRRVLTAGGLSGSGMVALRGGVWSVEWPGGQRGAPCRRSNIGVQCWIVSCCRRREASFVRRVAARELHRWRCRWRRWWGTVRRWEQERRAAWRWQGRVWRCGRRRRRRSSRRELSVCPWGVRWVVPE